MTMTNTELRIQVLLHQSTQLQNTIDGLLATTLRIVGWVVPAVVGVLTLIVANVDAAVPSDVAALALTGVFVAAVMYSNAIWGDLLSYIEYQFCTLHAELNTLSGAAPDAHMFAFVADRYHVAIWLPKLLFAVVVFALIGYLSLGLIDARPALGIAIAGLLASALISSIVVLHRTTNLVRSFRRGGLHRK